MQQGYLSQYFEGVAIKRLKAVEVDLKSSHQHEINGTTKMKQLLGSDYRRYLARFFWFGEDGVTEQSTAVVTWYDTRKRNLNRSAEFRLYFQSNRVMDQASLGDLLIVAKRADGEYNLIVVRAGTTLERQLLWLFQAPDTLGEKFNVRYFDEKNDPQVDLAVRFILEELGIEVEEVEAEEELLDRLLKPYIGEGFPTTTEFSALARETVYGVSAQEDPDHALLQWMECEERMFRRLEWHLVGKRLKEGFVHGETVDVDGFIRYSLSVQNARKSRVGYALENHIEELFKIHKLSYSRNKITENRSKPDFLFPSVLHYHDPACPVELLTMLGVKSTCKDRWRQVLAEANKIHNKHLLTLEPGISVSQTEEMRNSNLQLVLPRSLHITYTQQQQQWLMNIRDFLSIVRDRQSSVI